MRRKPKNYDRNTTLKNRRTWGVKTTSLSYGNTGILPLDHILILKKTKKWIRVQIKRLLKCRGLIHKFFWIRIRVSKTLTRKNNKSRMGKGKGKIVNTFGYIKRGQIFLQFKRWVYEYTKRFARILSIKYGRKLCAVRQPNHFEQSVHSNRFIYYKQWDYKRKEWMRVNNVL